MSIGSFSCHLLYMSFVVFVVYVICCICCICHLLYLLYTSFVVFVVYVHCSEIVTLPPNLRTMGTDHDYAGQGDREEEDEVTGTTC